MKDNVKLEYGGVKYFSCNLPYTNCYTRFTNDGSYDFSINDDSLIAIFFVRENQNDGTWSCYHGNERAYFVIDNADAPRISYITSRSISGDKNEKYEFQCKIKSQMPADVVIYSQNYLGVRKLYERKQTRITQHKITVSVRCEDRYIFCNVSNGYGPIISRSRTVYKDCPLKILGNLSTTTLSYNKSGTELKFKIYYEGYTYLSLSFYRITSDGFQEVRSNGNFSLGLIQYPIRYARIIFRNLEESDGGKYVLSLRDTSRTPYVNKLCFITLVYTGTSTTEGIDQPTTTTTSTTSITIPRDLLSTGSQFGGKTEDETNIMIYLGVAAFVIVLLLILVLVIVGVFWFIRIKRKPAASDDKVYYYFYFSS
ncbi:hypothetical protein LOTGIDRAFT_156369 [Lottia gigantea]|uniref:Uncharacterized protein n=1 Tax=Lottia gigantea TaxID=225164 RepID=V4B0R5_LOTGI|nr:hypothetical protein LOTGIDRAFT_156369 [Lottia gigantea]ESP03808.1 hypothetical protein LOTGIDRAFT_156369 [Lottia gigantea]